MDRNPYVDFCLSVQALRREFERVRSPLAPAIGVAASLYTHQLSNVHRVLTDVRVRHLLADEVGLGKTVQALMILNALRCERTDLQVLVVVPDRLVPQWRDEIMTRAHRAPFDRISRAEEGQYIRLAWEAQRGMRDSEGNALFNLADIDPNRFDVLVVDELHRLTAEVQDRIVKVAKDFDHIMVLTATPALQRKDRHAQLFAMLEPERSTLARWQVATSDQGVAEELTVSDDLRKWPAWAAGAVVESFIEKDRDAADSSESRDLTIAALTHCAYRRFIRTRRTDFSGVLPCRRHQPIVVQPLGAEADRQSLMWEYLTYLDKLSEQVDPILIAKRVVLSPPSLEQRVDYFRRKGHDRVGLLERVKPLVHRSQGDSRADALVDLLAKIWSEDPTERVLVAAQDNLTVDYLYALVLARLPEIGPLGQRAQLKAALIRQGHTEEMLEDLGGFGNDTAVNLEEFQRGEALVLFAPEKAQVGLNFQRARILVLYSVPWRPEEVEQWIGRIDRIGNCAAFAGDGSAKTVDIYTIAQHGLVDEKVVAVLQHFHVFERSVNLDGDHLEEVAKLIEEAALHPGRTSWHELKDATEAMAAEDEVKELNSALRKHLPWTVRSATAERQRLESMPPGPFVLKDLPEHSTQGPRAWDRAFEGMLNLLRRVGDYHIRCNTDPNTGNRFQTLWYRFGPPGMYGHRDVLSKVVFQFGADPWHDRSPKNAHAFITRRGDIGTPPQRDVTLNLDGDHVQRPLRFLNFGDPLHDALIRGWLPQNDGLVRLDVSFFDNHALWIHGAPGLYLIRLAIIDPASALLHRGLTERMREALTDAAIHSDSEQLDDLLRPFTAANQCALEADVRWLRTQLTASMTFEVRRRNQDHWISVGADVANTILNPMAHGLEGVPQARGLPLSEEENVAAQIELSKQRQAEVNLARSTWSHRFPDFEQELATRIEVVEEEGRDALEIARLGLRLAEQRLKVTQERGNRAQIARAQNISDVAAGTLNMTRAFWDERVRWLRECNELVREIQPEERITALIRARKVH